MSKYIFSAELNEVVIGTLKLSGYAVKGKQTNLL